ncbi:hypothetical protein IAD21_02228 [Abditibacteriota bacterium]|nr:hypothetical protein IAD21_02228 [Abditibacteriota bacterium]
MRLTYFGHACFGVQTLGYRLVLDPFSPEIGYAPLQTKADLVCISHENPKWHSHLESVGGDWTLYNALENIGQTWDFDGISLEAFPVFEDWPDNGEPVGPNAMFKITSENLRLLHMGDVGHALGDDYIEALGEVDIVLAPFGGPPTIELTDLKAFLDELNPRLVVPMHYMVEGLKMQLEPLDSFLNLWDGRVERAGKSELELKMDDLPSKTTLQLLEPLRLKR